MQSLFVCARLFTERYPLPQFVFLSRQSHVSLPNIRFFSDVSDCNMIICFNVMPFS